MGIRILCGGASSVRVATLSISDGLAAVQSVAQAHSGLRVRPAAWLCVSLGPRPMKQALRICSRPDPTSIVGDGRDIDILSDIDQCGFLVTRQIEELRFPSRRTAQRRLRALLDHNWVRAHLQGDSLHRDNVYTLTSLGIDRLIESGREPYNSKPKRLPAVGKLQHAIRIRDVYVAARKLTKDGSLTLVDFRFDDDLAAEPELRTARLIPDAVIFLALAGDLGARRSVAVEVDLGTEKLETIRQKLATYRNLLADRVVHELVILAAREGRKTSIAKLVDECPIGHTHIGLLETTDCIVTTLRAAVIY